MGKLIAVIIVAVAGWYAWQWYANEPVDSAQADPSTAEQGPDFSENGSAATASLDNLDGGDVPQDFSEALKAAQATWDQYQQEKDDATLHPQAAALAATYSKLLKQTYNQPALKKIQLELIRDRLKPLSERLFFSSKSYKDDKSGLFVYHEVQNGELLNTIGRKYGMSYQFINIMRGKKPENSILNVGEDLKLLNAKQKGYLLHIDKSDFYLDLYACGVFVKRYAIGHGAPETETPTGETFIEARVLHPQWTDPKDNRVYNYGQEGHILGPVWLAFNKEIGKSGLGIHGYTGKGKATGVEASNGCIRMKNDEAVELYNLMVNVVNKPKFITRAPMKVRIVE